MVLKFKLFTEERLVIRMPGGAPGSSISTTNSSPVDEAVTAWFRETGRRFVACSPPTVHTQWVDQEMTRQLMLIAVLVTYQEPE